MYIYNQYIYNEAINIYKYLSYTQKKIFYQKVL